MCVSKLTIIGSDNGLSPDRCQAIIWTNDGLLLIGPLGTNFNEILIKILTFLFKKMRLKVSSAKRQPFCLGLNVLTQKGHACMGSSTQFDRWIIVLETIDILQSVSWLIPAATRTHSITLRALITSHGNMILPNAWSWILAPRIYILSLKSPQI